MDFDKIAEVEKMLNEYKMEKLEESKLKTIVINASTELRIMGTALLNIARRFELCNDDPFNQYQLLLKSAIKEIIDRRGITKKDIAVEMEVSPFCLYEFMKFGIRKPDAIILKSAENYLEQCGYDIEGMKEQSGY